MPLSDQLKTRSSLAGSVGYPDSGEEYFVYSCNNQDQDLDAVDFDHLNARLGHNLVQEKLSALWLD